MDGKASKLHNSVGTRSIEVSSWDKGMQELGVSKDIADRLLKEQTHEKAARRTRVCTTELLCAEVWGRTGRRAQGKQAWGVKRRIGGEVVI